MGTQKARVRMTNDTNMREKLESENKICIKNSIYLPLYWTFFSLHTFATSFFCFHILFFVNLFISLKLAWLYTFEWLKNITIPNITIQGN